MGTSCTPTWALSKKTLSSSAAPVPPHRDPHLPLQQPALLHFSRTCTGAAHSPFMIKSSIYASSSSSVLISMSWNQSKRNTSEKWILKNSARKKEPEQVSILCYIWPAQPLCPNLQHPPAADSCSDSTPSFPCQHLKDNNGNPSAPDAQTMHSSDGLTVLILIKAGLVGVLLDATFS